MLLAAGIITYQDCKGLERCIDSIIDGVDIIFVIDGKYPEYGTSDSPQYSTDGTLELCQAYNDRLGYEMIVRYVKMSDSQRMKRNAYLSLASEHKCPFLLVIDADEYIAKGADWQQFRTILQTSKRFESGINSGHQAIGLDGKRFAYPVYNHNIAYQAAPNTLISLARLIYRPQDLIYVNHWFLYTRETLQPTSYQNTNDANVIPGITIVTDEKCRPDSRLQVDLDYQWLLFKQEHIISDAEYRDPRAKARFADKLIRERDISLLINQD